MSRRLSNSKEISNDTILAGLALYLVVDKCISMSLPGILDLLVLHIVRHAPVIVFTDIMQPGLEVLRDLSTGTARVTRFAVRVAVIAAQAINII